MSAFYFGQVGVEAGGGGGVGWGRERDGEVMDRGRMQLLFQEQCL